jgi:hypothetical protein
MPQTDAMSNDEFRDVGRYFSLDDYVSLPTQLAGGDCTLTGWFIRVSGDGAFLASDDQTWATAYKRDGRLTYRIGGEERITQTSLADLMDRWIFISLAKSGPSVSLRVDHQEADSWDEAPAVAPVNSWVSMAGVEGFAADIAFFERRLPDERLDALWNAGKDGRRPQRRAG